MPLLLLNNLSSLESHLALALIKPLHRSSSFLLQPQIELVFNATLTLELLIFFRACVSSNPYLNLQPIWDAIVDFKPQVFIWLGDNIYGDIRRPFKLFGNERTIGPWKNVPRFVPSSEDQMKSKYNIAKTNHGYSRLRKIAKVLYFTLLAQKHHISSCIVCIYTHTTTTL